jgi:cytochrome c peroxidase
MRFSHLILINFLMYLCVSSLAQEPTVVEKSINNIQKATLGNLLFNDVTLSNPAGQACATCHVASAAFAENKAVSVGVTGSLGTRNAPTLMYNKYTPAFREFDVQGAWVGGQFWDGRANSIQEQALGPLLNPIEMNNTRATLAKNLRNVKYLTLFTKIYGDEILKNDDLLINAATDALSEFQVTDTLSPFTSKFDYAEKGLIKLTEQEQLGRKIYEKNMCTDCHAGIAEDKQIFTNFRFHNIMVPPNPAIPGDETTPDAGLANNPNLNVAQKKSSAGQFKTPTLRNIALTAPYMHNGVFTTLKEVVEFYNDMEDRERWGPTPFAENSSQLLNTKLGLSAQEIDALVAFLKTLTDGYELETPTPI